MKTTLWLLPAVLLASILSTAQASVWLPSTGGSWAVSTNWDTGTVPNAVGASAMFANNATASRTITNDSGAAGFTVGNITFDSNTAFNNSLTTGTTNSKLTLDNGGAGVTLLTTGLGTGTTRSPCRWSLPTPSPPRWIRLPPPRRRLAESTATMTGTGASSSKATGSQPLAPAPKPTLARQ